MKRRIFLYACLISMFSIPAVLAQGRRLNLLNPVSLSKAKPRTQQPPQKPLTKSLRIEKQGITLRYPDAWSEDVSNLTNVQVLTRSGVPGTGAQITISVTPRR